MLLCKVCGSELDPTIENHYVARDIEKQGISTMISCDEPKWYDAFNCPVCGCQVIAQERKRAEYGFGKSLRCVRSAEDEDYITEDEEENE